MKVAIVIGTRAEILKVYSVIKELRRRKISHRVYFTAQHFSADMAKNFFKELGINISEEYNGKFDKWKTISWIEKKLKEFAPDVVLVQGDTDSSLAGALAASYLQIPVGHIEAGLRSFDLKEPFPDEMNRVLIDAISTYYFFPTERNSRNIETADIQVLEELKTKLPVSQIPYNNSVYKIGVICGNTIVDLLREKAKHYKTKDNMVLITTHKKTNWDNIKDICDAVKTLSEEMPEHTFKFVKHSNKNINKDIEKELEGTKVELINPMPYSEFIDLVARANFILSDSGVMVEEASYLKTPLFILSNKTERPEALLCGHAFLTGTRKEDIVPMVPIFLRHYKQDSPCPFGTGDSAKIIVSVLKGEFE